MINYLFNNSHYDTLFIEHKKRVCLKGNYDNLHKSKENLSLQGSFFLTSLFSYFLLG